MRTFVIYYDDGREQRIQRDADIHEVTEEFIHQEGVDAVGELVWHTFTDNGYDNFWHYENDARRDYQKLCKDHANVRLYWEINDVNGDAIEEDHILGQGDFPT